MARYSYGPLAIVEPDSTGGAADLIRQNATGGVMYQTNADAIAQSSPLALYDFNGSPLAEITSGPFGQAQWVAEQTEPGGFVRIGGLIIAVTANETGPLAARAAAAEDNAAQAAAAAQQALQQLKDFIAANPGGGGGGGTGGVTDHGALSGLADDDHLQYLNNTRGDARYYTKTAADAAISTSVAANSTADRNRSNHSGTQLASSISDLSPAVTSLVYPSGFVDLSRVPAGYTHSITLTAAKAAATRAAVTSRTDIVIRVYGGTAVTDWASPWLLDGVDFWDLVPNA